MQIVQGEVVDVTVPSPSGKNQIISRCPKCQVAVWSYYLVMFGGIGELIRFIRVGTLDEPDRIPPDAHIYTSSKQPWVTLPADALAVDEFYVIDEVWPEESLERRAALLAAAKK